MQSVQKPVRRELDQVQTQLRQLFRTPIPIINEVGGHVLATRGKKFRPTLLLLTARLRGNLGREAVLCATVVEMVHAAALIHDDSVDKSGLRRGLPTVNGLWTDEMAIIMGDYLYAQSMAMLVENGHNTAMSIMARVVSEMSCGEALEFQHAFDLGVTEAQYEDLIRAKTGSLIGAATEIGAGLNGGARDLRDEDDQHDQDLREGVLHQAQLRHRVGHAAEHRLFGGQVLWRYAFEGAGREVVERATAPRSTAATPRCRRLRHGEVERDPDAPGMAAAAEDVRRRAVREQGVMGGAQGRGPVGHSRGLRPVRVAEEGRDPRLVVGDPVGHAVAERAEDVPGVVREALDDVARRPTALVLERLRQVPVVERRERRDPALEQAVDERGVEVEPLPIRPAAPVGLDARPRDREAVALEPERLHQVEVLAPAVVVVAGGLAGVAVRDLPGQGREAVPDRLAAAVRARRALDLERRGRGAPDEAVAAGIHPFTAPFMIPPMIWRPRTRKTKSSGRIETNVPVSTSAKSCT